jgi:NAD(P)-dependent dehydrogenase (short-subunit alcohol dehydrogenase family)
MDLDLKGKRVVVPGSSHGIGFVIARCVLKGGAQVTIRGIDAARLTHAEMQLSRYRAHLGAADSGISIADDVTSLFGVTDRENHCLSPIL